MKINSLQLGEGNVKASAAIVLDDFIEIRNVKVMNGKNGLFASMPSYLASDNKYCEICAPVNKEIRAEISSAVVNAYKQTLSQMQGQAPANLSQSEQSYEAAPAMSMSM